jgi:hypothetical protein
MLRHRVIREARHEDITAIRRLMEVEPGFWQQGWTNETLARGIDSAGGLAFICEKGDEIIGFVCAHDVGPERTYCRQAGEGARRR